MTSACPARPRRSSCDRRTRMRVFLRSTSRRALAVSGVIAVLTAGTPKPTAHAIPTSRCPPNPNEFPLAAGRLEIFIRPPSVLATDVARFVGSGGHGDRGDAAAAAMRRACGGGLRAAAS